MEAEIAVVTVLLKCLAEFHLLRMVAAVCSPFDRSRSVAKVSSKYPVQGFGCHGLITH